ncbi:MAG: efflux transporter periplasmic adaptor subunit [Gammaproteobacteria bacterium]|nr:efflux transporter periplasmic adaptor subunit [Gammaproteobacteria bacterium]
MNRMRMSRPRVVMLSAAAALALLLLWHWRAGAARPADSGAGAASKAVAVDTALAGRADVPVFLEGLGTVQAFYTVTVTTRVDGELQKVAFVEGQTVNKGDLIGQIDPRPFQAALDLATAAHAKDVAQLASAQADLERYEILAPQNLASKQTLDAQHALVGQLEAQIKGDQATIENARTQLGYTTITSPIQGRTGIRRVDPGNNVHATDTGGIVTVTQVQPIACIFTLPEESLPTLSKALAAGGPVKVTAVSRDGQTELDSGTVALIDNQIDQTTGTIRVKATFANAHNTLWPGEFVNARVLVQTERNALTIPSAAIQRGPDGMFTYVVKADSTVEARPLQVGAESGSLTVIANGIQDGERVVTSNQYRLQPGARVRNNPAAAAAQPRVAKS